MQRPVIHAAAEQNKILDAFIICRFNDKISRASAFAFATGALS
jgi:hypothetical protein